MNGITEFAVNGVAVYSPVAASPRFVAHRFGAQQGTALSEMHAFGVIAVDKPAAGWRPAVAEAAAGVAAPISARLRNADHPASVIRSRHRCRHR